LVRGERGVVLCIAQSKEVAKIVLDFTVGLFEASALLRPLIATRNQESLTLTSGITIEVRTASFRSLRGPSYVCAICDEIAFWYSDEQSANPDAEIIAAIEPALGLTHGMLILASSPYARRGVLWDKFKRYYGEDHPGILVARGTTRDLNPLYSQARIDQAIAENPAKNRAEYLAEFRRDIEGYVSLEALEACVIPGCYERRPERDTSYLGFCDPSGGGGQDGMTLCIGHTDHATDTVVIDCLRERMPPFSPEQVVEEFSAVLRSYRVSSVFGDRFGGMWAGRGVQQARHFLHPRRRADQVRALRRQPRAAQFRPGRAAGHRQADRPVRRPRMHHDARRRQGADRPRPRRP
jgi:hypothetical protein